MVFDLSGVKVVVQDTLRASDEYSSHDPKLATELSSKAYEICREFDINVASLDERKSIEPHSHARGTASATKHDSEPDHGQADNHLDAFEDQDQLCHTLDRQRALLEVQALEDDRQSNKKPRSILPGWNMFSFRI